MLAMNSPKLRLGLCCQLIEQPVKFRVTTATASQRLPRREQLARLGELAAHNAGALLAVLRLLTWVARKAALQSHGNDAHK